LKKSGLYENSIIVMYGDHYGISNSRNKYLAELVGESKDDWNEWNDAQMQRVPVMFHVPGQQNGKISETYGGQVDILPSLLHLLGIDTSNYIQLGQDLFAEDRDQIVAFRNGTFVTPKYTVIGQSVYLNETGELLTELTEEQTNEVEFAREKASTQLTMSDALTNGDLLRFYTESGLEPVNPEDYDYKNGLEKLLSIEEEKGDKSTSVFSKHGNKSTQDMYETKTYQDYYGPKEKETTTTSPSNK
jgi:lipoteichoic acid synthase